MNTDAKKSSHSSLDWVQDSQALLDVKDLSHCTNRRSALKLAMGLGAGFAAAVQPVAAQTVVNTPAGGLLVGEVSVGPDKLPAYRAAPAAGKNLPVVLVVQEIFGVHEHIADVCRRFAQQGYLAIAPELYFRQGDPGQYAEIAKLQAEIVSKVPDAQVMQDLDACVAWAAEHGGDTKRVGITGFCWGGRITWLYCAHSSQVKAGVAWYGRLVGNATTNTPKHAVDLAAKLQAPVLGLYGAADTGIPIDTIDTMKTALAQAASAGNQAAAASEFIIYPDAPHAFHADYRPSYRKQAAQDGWQRCLAWLQRWGVK